jgi:precorrin-6B methylase 2
LTRLQLACLALAGAGTLSATVLLNQALPLSPTPSSVIDRAALLSDHDRLLADHDIDYRVVTTRLDGAIESAGHESFAEIEAGARSRSGRGLLLLIDPESDRVRLEVAAALEGVFTDAFVAYLEQRQMVPFFRENRVADGVMATTELIFARAQNAAAGHEFEPMAAASFSLGGGATSAARIGAGADRGRAQDGAQVVAQATPEATVAAYLAAMAARNGRTDLAVYNEATRRMLDSWTMTPAQMDGVARAYRNCPDGEVRYHDRGDLAVVRYPPAARQCAPWFLTRKRGRWSLDLTVAQRVVRFNHRNHWRMPDPAGHPYAFAFADWRFDGRGFPIAGH